jgi:hypothetical protein
MRMAKHAACAFTETAVKRAIRAVRAAGETPGRVVVTKDGFAIEIGGVLHSDTGGGLANDDGDGDHDNPELMWDKLTGLTKG